LLIIGLLILPFQLCIDTNTNTYYLRWQGIAKARLIPLPDDFLLRLNILFFRKDFYLLERLATAPEKKPRAEESEKKKARKKKRKGWTAKTWRRKMVRLLKSFQVKVFRLNMDTDDYVYNSYLYPIFYFLSKGNRRLRINYQGEGELVLVVQNRPWRLIWAFLF
jgi:hypothetical protein